MSAIRFNTTQFINEINEFPEGTLKTEYRDFIRSVTVLMALSAILDTPVRTGQMRGSWVVGIGKPDTETIGPIDTVGDLTIRRIRRVLRGAFNPYLNIYFGNNDRGVSFVNDGGPDNVPQRMMEKAIAKAERIIR